MNYTYQGKHPPSELVTMVSQSNALCEDEDWLADSGANNYIMGDLENLTIQQPYNEAENVAVGNGSSLPIAHMGSSSFKTQDAIVQLKNILHCPNATSNLLSINCFYRDNNCYFKLTDTYFLVKDNLTGKIIL